MKSIYFRRAIGNTRALINGAKNSDCIFVCLNEAHADYIKRQYPDIKRNNIKTIDNNLIAIGRPVILDHSIFEIVQQEKNDLKSSIEGYEKNIVNLRRTNGELLIAIEEATNKIVELTRKPRRPKKPKKPKNKWQKFWKYLLNNDQ